jgi:hypothetical protein
MNPPIKSIPSPSFSRRNFFPSTDHKRVRDRVDRADHQASESAVSRRRPILEREIASTNDVSVLIHVDIRQRAAGKTGRCKNSKQSHASNSSIPAIKSIRPSPFAAFVNSVFAEDRFSKTVSATRPLAGR